MRVTRQNQHLQKTEPRMSRFSGQRSESRESNSRDEQVRLSNSMHFKGHHHHHPPPPAAYSAHHTTGLGATSPPGRGQRRGVASEEKKSTQKLKMWGEEPLQSNPPNSKYTDLTQQQAAIVHNYGSHPPLQRIALKEPMGSQSTTINSQSVVININRNYNLTNSIIEQEAENQPDETEEQKQKKKKKKRQLQDSLEAASRYQGSSEIPSNAYEAVKPKKNLQQLNSDDIKIRTANPRQAQSSYGVRRKGKTTANEQLRSPSPVGGGNEYKGGMILASSAVSGKTRKKYEQIEMMRSAQFSREMKRNESPDFLEEARIRNLHSNPLVSLLNLQKALSSESATLPLDSHTQYQNESQPSLEVTKSTHKSVIAPATSFSNSSSPFTAGGRIMNASDNLPALKSGKKQASQRKPAPRFNVYSHQSDSSSPVILPPGITRQNMKEPQRTSTAIGTRSKNLKLMYANIHPPSTADGKRVSFQNPQKLYQAMSEEEISAFAKSYHDQIKKQPHRKHSKPKNEPILKMQDRSDSIPEQPDALGLVSSENTNRDTEEKKESNEEKKQEKEEEKTEEISAESPAPRINTAILEDVGHQSQSGLQTSSQQTPEIVIKSEQDEIGETDGEVVFRGREPSKLRAAEAALDEAERLIQGVSE